MFVSSFLAQRSVDYLTDPEVAALISLSNCLGKLCCACVNARTALLPEQSRDVDWFTGRIYLK